MVEYMVNHSVTREMWCKQARDTQARQQICTCHKRYASVLQFACGDTKGCPGESSCNSISHTGEAAVCRSQHAALAVAAPAVTALPCIHALPPRTVQKALGRPDASQWQQIIDDEITSCLEFDGSEATDLPEVK
jgi:hypothetical protein